MDRLESDTARGSGLLEADGSRRPWRCLTIRARSDLRHRRCSGTSRARLARCPGLYVTSLGLHRVSINGRPVSEDLLAPGWTSRSEQRLIAESLTTSASLLKPGPQRHRGGARRRLVSRSPLDGTRGRRSGATTDRGCRHLSPSSRSPASRTGQSRRVIVYRPPLGLRRPVRSGSADLHGRRGRRPQPVFGTGWDAARFTTRAAGRPSSQSSPFDVGVIEPRVRPTGSCGCDDACDDDLLNDGGQRETLPDGGQTSRGSSGCGCRGRVWRTRPRAARGGARARRVAPPRSLRRQSDRCLRPRGRLGW